SRSPFLSQRAAQRPPFQSHPDPAFERVEMPIRWACRREAEILLNAMPGLVGVKAATLKLVFRQWPDQHRPLHTGPLDGGVRNVHPGRQCPDKGAAGWFQHALEIDFIGSDGARLRIREQQWPA